MESLKTQWQELCAPYGADRKVIHQYWMEIQNAYRGKRRYYHNLQHIQNLLEQTERQQADINDYDGLRFAIFYHDIVYSSLRKDNESRSALLAQKRLEKLRVPSRRITHCLKLILATQDHQLPSASSDPDLRYFLDFDLSILGADWEQYKCYTQQIRKEYQIYPGWMYRKGRLKVLSKFLKRSCLYFTPLYFEQFEIKARNNLNRELQLL